MTRHVFMAVAIVALGVAVSGCTLYSEQHYGPQSLGGVKTLQECLDKAGGPDLMHKAGDKTVCVYHKLDAMQVLSIYGYVEKKDRVLVFDSRGNQVSDDVVDKGRGVFIFGWMSPAFETE